VVIVVDYFSYFSPIKVNRHFCLFLKKLKFNWPKNETLQAEVFFSLPC
jgi:hypothetical protein